MLWFSLWLGTLILFSCTGSSQKSLNVAAIGDVLLDRTPGARLNQVGRQMFFGPLRSTLLNHDISFANLESPFAQQPDLRRDKPADLTFCADPSRLKDLAWAGVSVVSLANNHMEDAGNTGILQTITALDAVGIAHAGAGADEQEAYAPAVLTINGWRIAVVALDAVFTGRLPAGPGRPGIAQARLDTIAERLHAVRERLAPDLLIVSVHWGDEFVSMPTAFEREFAHACLDAGAVIVLGHHPHVLQGFEFWNGGLVAYSLGNAVFSQPGDEERSSIVLEVKLNHNGLESAKVIPMVIDQFLASPRPAFGRERTLILNRVRDRSPNMDIAEDGTLKQGARP